MKDWQRLSVAAFVCWALAFGAESLRLAHAVVSLYRTNDRLEAAARTLDGRSREIVGLAKQIRSDSEESEFLNRLPNFLPQDRSFLRTQHVIAGEVADLRRKVGQRLRGSLHIVVDAKANKLYLKKGLKLLWKADCSAGRGGTLVDPKTGRRWEFVTPRGEFKVIGKTENPEWVKPDWAYVESKEPVPPPEDPVRKVAGELGAYVFNLGDGYLIHGTKREDLLGQPASHGCVRLGAADLKKLYDSVPVNTKAIIY
ncbi:MAG: L,D-transpeptidase [Elusimicrobia bacterium]|nr:L,D-transpeptidase [Elusimicrobiota bacterium]